ncbi:3-phosphoshikimate 1-carboxyvinyltransferase [Brevibacillus sp. NRS-1366]|uniref:3-phosphoshikimate 1-carboxyvinyltransferase n=1 Tax=Brevibacillus sp. NRS-1366 TaxID=3233899 RepID=UPI003D1CEDBF
MKARSKNQPDWEARSPWSKYNNKQTVSVLPHSGGVDGDITVSGSKSLTNRALIIAALAEGTSTIEGILKSDDSYWCISALRELGIRVEVQGETAIVEGAAGKWPNQDCELYVGSAGTIARFLPGALAAGTGTWKLRGSKQMSERPLAPLLDALKSMGAVIHYEEMKGCLPLTLKAAGLQGGLANVPGSTSSQFISGLLLASPYAREALTIHINGGSVQPDYIKMTIDMMRAFGVDPIINNDGQTISVHPARYKASSVILEPDVSTCGYFWAIAALTNGRIRINGITAKTLQPDIELVEILERMGCIITRGDGFVEVHGTGQLKGGFTHSMKRCSDQTLTIAALAPFADGPITLTDAAHIRHHECDRITAVCTELGKLGVRVEEHPDGLTVYPGVPHAALLDSHDDHRMAMALSLISLRVEGIRIADPGCVSKTCPDYFDRLLALGIGVDFE